MYFTNMKSYYLALIFFFVTSTIIFAQQQLNGIVVDATSQQPLPFVNITFNFDNKKGTTTDIDGYFEYQSTKPIQHLVLSYIG